MKSNLSGIDSLELNLAARVCVGDALTRVARVLGSREAVIDRGRPVTYRELDDAAEALGRAFLDAGIERQQPVAMLMADGWKLLATYFACAKSALVAMPVSIALTAEDIEWILRDAGAAVVVADAAFVPLLEAALPRLDSVRTVVVVDAAVDEIAGRAVQRWETLVDRGADGRLEVIVEDRDLVQCLYTSGTTSHPKGVLTSHVSVMVAGLTNALMQGSSWGNSPSTLLNVLPLFHTTGLNTLVLPMLMTGGRVVLPGRFDPAVVLDAIEKHDVTHAMLLPIMWKALVDVNAAAPRNLESVRLCIYAMAQMPAEVLDRVDAAFPNAAVILGSGQTEVVPATALQWPEHRTTKPGSWGPPVPTVEVAIMDADGTLLASGETGEIVYRGPHVCSGYWNNMEANTKAFAHGWFHSGDIGHIDEEGVVWFTDRLKDIIKSGGENVSSIEVERVVANVPGVLECSVIGVPDERWGEAVCVAVVPVPDTGEDGLEARILDHARQQLAGFQVPKRVIVVEALPKTATGKTRKHELRTAVQSRV
ncbi:acyl-CoA synthetase (AMP-forming)/AMP-acid ligase II [Rhodococcus sp. AG1013]|uniref:class I adenylate-forming enzyme family protein n=1 Tax=Rhodococcus sp. AG1013 TaxID=2183996 RepID=UPI000E2D8067|nr:AMP-binding protein [Rhodococcus sp. AG1013]RDI18443.1 acyl-CoA synthetase (AMP-forming)/AMP-acid ligase II [Rhodococcus sp. AG1013]